MFVCFFVCTFALQLDTMYLCTCICYRDIDAEERLCLPMKSLFPLYNDVLLLSGHWRRPYFVFNIWKNSAFWIWIYMYSASAEFATESDLCCGLCKGGIHGNQATKIATKFPPEVAEDSVACCRSSLRSDGFYAYIIKLYNPWKNFYGEVRTLRRYVFSPN